MPTRRPCRTSSTPTRSTAWLMVMTSWRRSMARSSGTSVPVTARTPPSSLNPGELLGRAAHSQLRVLAPDLDLDGAGRAGRGLVAHAVLAVQVRGELLQPLGDGERRERLNVDAGVRLRQLTEVPLHVPGEDGVPGRTAGEGPARARQHQHGH